VLAKKFCLVKDSSFFSDLSKVEKLSMLRVHKHVIMSDSNASETKDKLNPVESQEVVDPDGILVTGSVEGIHEGRKFGLFGLDDVLPDGMDAGGVESWQIPDDHAEQIRIRRKLPATMKLHGWIEKKRVEKESAAPEKAPVEAEEIEEKKERGPVIIPALEKTKEEPEKSSAFTSPEEDEKGIVPDNLASIVGNVNDKEEGVPIDQALSLIKEHIGGKSGGSAHEIAELAKKHHTAHKKKAA
jgi:hypothetical protein